MPIEATLSTGGTARGCVSSDTDAPEEWMTVEQETTFQIAAATRFNNPSENRTLTLKVLAEKIQALPAVADKKDGFIIHPGRFEHGVRTRTLGNIQACTGAAYDFDGRGGDTVKREDFEAVCREAGVEVITWLTHSAPDDPTGCTFRALIPYKAELPVDLHRPALVAIGKMLGMVPGTILHAAQGFFCQPRPGVEHDVRVLPGKPIDTLIDLHGLEPVAEASPDHQERASDTAGEVLTPEQVADATTVIDALRARGLHEVTGKGIWHRVIGALAPYGDQGEPLAMRFSEGGCKTWKKDTLKKLVQKRKKGATGIANLFAIAAEYGIENPGAGHRPSAEDEFADDFGGEASGGDKATPPPDTPPRSVINAPEPFPGIHSKLTAAILAASYIPQPNLASLCALIALSALCGGSAYEDGTRCNLFGALLSESSSGKEKPVECAQAAVIEGTVPVLSTPASGEALEDALPPGPVLMIMREAAHIFRVMSGDNAQPHAVSLARMILDLFSAGERDKYLKRLKAGQGEQDRVAVANPALSVLLASTPGKLGEALSTDNIGDGLLGRLLYAEGDPGAERQRHPTRFKVPAEIGFVEKWVTILTMSEAADELLWQMTLGFDAQRKELLKNDDRATAALLGRRAEKIKRIAGILASTVGGTVTSEMVTWAGKFCEASDAVLLSFTEEHLDKSKDIRDTDKVMAAARAILAGTIRGQRKWYDAAIASGFIPTAMCLKASHLSKAKFDLAVEHLVAVDAIQQPGFEGKPALCLGA